MDDQTKMMADEFAELQKGKAPRPGPCGFDSLAPIFMAEFERAKADRRAIEERWLMDLRQFKGRYDPETLGRIGNRSKAFAKRTQTKVRTANARMMDLLFPSGGDRNYLITHTPNPTLPPVKLKALLKEMTTALGLSSPKQLDKKMVHEAVVDVAQKSAEAMMATIDDQLAEARYKRECKRVIASGNLYGTGVLKGPLVERKERTHYAIDKATGRWQISSEQYNAPFVEYTPLWRFYPDMSATDIEECRYVYEQHRMTRAAMVALSRRKSFDGQAIRDHIEANPDGCSTQDDVDTELLALGDRDAVRMIDAGLYDVLERWGWVTGRQLADAGVDVPDDRLYEDFFCNAWVLPSDGKVLKLSINPLPGQRYPYHIYYLEQDETNIFGEGYATLLREDQIMLNTALRMMLDNAAKTSGPIYERNVRLMSPTSRSDNDMYPGKIIDRDGESPEMPALRVHQVDSRVNELSGIIDLFETYMDEDSTLPRYMTGSNPTDGAAATMGGLSMLMSASSIVLKDSVVNYDEGVTRPFMTALYRWNMALTDDPDIKGDFEIKARGASALMAREVRGQQLLAFGANLPPESRGAVRWDEFARELATTMETSGLVKTIQEIQAETESDTAKQAAQFQQQMAMAQLSELLAKVAKTQAEVEKLKASAMNEKVGSIYSAMQAGGAAVQNAGVAPAADEILRSAGWQDAPQGNPAPQAPQPGAQGGEIPPMQGPGEGMQQGIETPDMDAQV